MSEEIKGLKAQVNWCVDSIKEIAEAISENRPPVLKDEPPTDPPGEPKP